MALIVPTALTAHKTGSIGSVTFKGTKAGIVAQQRAHAKRPRINLQPSQISSFAYLASRYRAMSSAVRLPWETLFQHLKPTGYLTTRHKILSAPALYIHFNLSRLLFGVAVTDTPPQTQLCSPDLTSIFYWISQKWIMFRFDLIPLPPFEHLFVSLSYNVSPAMVYPRAWCRQRKRWSGPLSINSPWIMPTGYLDVTSLPYITTIHASPTALPSLPRVFRLVSGVP